MRKTIIAGNWKMNMLTSEALTLIEDLKKGIKEAGTPICDVIVCPTFTILSNLAEALKGTIIGLGGQNVYWEEKGAFTGEISTSMLLDVGCKYVIIGHSERRAYFNETNETVNKKIKASLNAGLTPIVCVGETLEQRENGITKNVIKDHIGDAYAGLSKEQALKTIIAYEPVWAIGTGKTATPEQAQEVHSFIRQLLKTLYNEDLAENISIQYGGSVKPNNVKDLMAQPDIDGALVGGASLKAKLFLPIIYYNK